MKTEKVNFKKGISAAESICLELLSDKQKYVDLCDNLGDILQWVGTGAIHQPAPFDFDDIVIQYISKARQEFKNLLACLDDLEPVEAAESSSELK